MNSSLRAHGHDIQYEGNPVSHHGGMCEKGRVDGWTDRTRPVPMFTDIAERGIITEHGNVGLVTGCEMLIIYKSPAGKGGMGNCNLVVLTINAFDTNTEM